MFEIQQNEHELQMVQFGMKGKVLFELPVLGQEGLPIGLMSAFGLFFDSLQSGTFTNDRVVSTWSYFIEVLRSNYPDAIIPLSRLTEPELKQVIEHWVKSSPEYDPKA